MSSKSKQQTKYYYIICGDKDKVSKKQQDLEKHMIDNFFYKNLDWDENRLALQERIKSYENFQQSFCAKNKNTGMDTDYGLINYISNSSNTVIYSIENKTIVDCVLLFREEQYENGELYIYVASFCANQVIPSKKGGIFFQHFLNSVRDKYTKINLSSSSQSYKFYKDFHFEDDKYGYMTRLLSPTAHNNRTRRRLYVESESEEDETPISESKATDEILKLSDLKDTWSSYKFTPFVKHNYYIIRANSKKVSKKHQNLEQHMIDKYKYKIAGSFISDRTGLANKILSYDKFFEDFCHSFQTTQGGIRTAYLTDSIKDDKYTIIYSIENDDIDSVLVFCSKKKPNKEFIWVDAFCSNQILYTKKGGIFFGYFLNSLRDNYKYIFLDSYADKFYKTFYFSKDYSYMSRRLSPKSAVNRTRKHYSPTKISGDVGIIDIPSQVHSLISKRNHRYSKRKHFSI